MSFNEHQRDELEFDPQLLAECKRSTIEMAAIETEMARYMILIIGILGTVEVTRTLTNPVEKIEVDSFGSAMKETLQEVTQQPVTDNEVYALSEVGITIFGMGLLKTFPTFLKKMFLSCFNNLNRIYAFMKLRLPPEQHSALLATKRAQEEMIRLGLEKRNKRVRGWPIWIKGLLNVDKIIVESQSKIDK